MACRLAGLSRSAYRRPLNADTVTAQVFAAFARGYNEVAPTWGVDPFSDEELVRTCHYDLSLDPRLGREEWDLVKRALKTELKYGLDRF